MKAKTTREIALELLIRVDKDTGYSHLLISEALKKHDLETRDEKLLTEIVYGTINYQLTLDFYLNDFLKKQKKIEKWVILLLRMSLYQSVYLDRVPDFAIINEAVDIAKRRGHKGIASFVNGVLRNITRQGIKSVESIENPVERLAVSTSHSEELVERWTTAYGFDTTQKICETNQIKKPMTLRVNLTKTTVQEVVNLLQQQAIEVQSSEIIPHALHVVSGNILKTNLISKGFVTIQDLSSMLASESLMLKNDLEILDCCSAPGGKATYIAEMMNQSGHVHAFDLHDKKVKMVHKSSKRLGLSNISTGTKDARHLSKQFDKETFDRILTDVPCSGFGVIRSKPDIKYSKTVEDIEHLARVQLAILTEVAPLLKKDGKLVYSTCTIEREENEAVIKKFLNQNRNYIVDDTFLDEMKHFKNVHLTDYGVQIFPHTFNSDGFFISRLIYKAS